MTVGNETIRDTKYEKLLGITIDPELDFNEHANSM